MSDPRAIVRNAADRNQVRNASRKERDRQQRIDDDLKAVLASAPGRRVLWRLIEESGCELDPTHARGDMTHQQIGRATVGRGLREAIKRVDHSAWITMQVEARAEESREHVEAEATRTTSASQTGGNDDE